MLLRTFWPSDEMAWVFALAAPAFRQESSHAEELKKDGGSSDSAR